MIALPNNLAVALKYSGKLRRPNAPTGEPLELLQILASAERREHYEIAVTLNDLAALLQQREDLAEAESLYMRALQMKTRPLGRKHPEVAVTVNNLAAL